MFFDAKYKILRRLSSLVNDGLFFVILQNCRFKPSIIFVVYIIRLISAGYAKNVDRISQLSSQLLTQLNDFFISPYQFGNCFNSRVSLAAFSCSAFAYTGSLAVKLNSLIVQSFSDK